MIKYNSVIVFYFSGTGNTELLASEIGRQFYTVSENVEFISIEDMEASGNVQFNDCLIGFGFPVYKLTYPDIFKKQFDLIRAKVSDSDYFIFSTYTRFNGNSLYHFYRDLNIYSGRLRGAASFKSPSCGISSRLDEEHYEYKSVMFFEDYIDIKIKDFADRIISNIESNKTVKAGNGFSLRDRIVINLTQRIELTKYPLLQINESRCSRCGLCVKKCPSDNFYIDDGAVLIKDDRTCLHCLRCMHHCPANSIDFGKLTRGPNRYTFRTRDDLFRKCIAGYKEPYWANFKSIVRKWRIRTIIYWLKYRNRPEV